MGHTERPVRKRTFLGAKIIFNRNTSIIDCLVRNISEGGARLTVSGTVAIPDEFDLLISVKEEMRRVRVAWRNEDEMGVAFIKTEGGA